MARKRLASTPPGRFRRLGGSLRRHWALVVVALVLMATFDDRHLIQISDAKQMTWTAIAIVETGEIGIADSAEGTIRGIHRAEGDAISRYGVGMTLAQLPAAFLAPYVDRALGPGCSEPLFGVAPLFFVLAACALSGWATRLLGGGPRGEAVTVLLTGLGSPLGSYASMAISEGLQAAALAAAFVAALIASQEKDARRGRVLAFAAGAAAGAALLAKTSLLLVVPFVLLPLAAGEERSENLRRTFWGAIGSLPLIALWLVFEIVRFGKPLSSYGGEGFTHPLFDGLWRLLVGPNKGLFLFFPAALLAIVAIGRQIRNGRGSLRKVVPALGSAGAFLTLLVMTATWWSWHGVVGWGPRLLVPSIPLLTPWAGVLVDSWSQLALRVVVGLSVLLNVPPLLVHPSTLGAYLFKMRQVPVEPWMHVPEGIWLDRDTKGNSYVPATEVLVTIPEASPFILYPWFLRIQLLHDEKEIVRRLQSPPWLTAHPEVAPNDAALADEPLRTYVPRYRWEFFGRTFFQDFPSLPPIYLVGLGDQVRRAHQTGQLPRGLVLAEKVAELGRNPDNEPLLAESYRLLGRRETLDAYLMGARSAPGGAHPWMPIIFALDAMDRGNEALARTTLGDAVRSFPGSPAEAAVRAPREAWPKDVYRMIEAPREAGATRPSLPVFGKSR